MGIVTASPNLWETAAAPMTIGGVPVSYKPSPHPTPAAAPKPSADTPAAHAYAAMLAAREAHQQYLADLQRSKSKLTPEGYREHLAAFKNTPQAQAVDAHEAAVIARRDKAVADYEQTLKGLSAEGDAAQESRNSRAWERHRRTLDNAKSPLDAAREVIKAATPTELGTLLEELPPYLAATGAPVDWINEEVERRVPELAAARATRNRADRAAAIVKYGVKRLHEGFATGRPPVGLVDPTATKIPCDPDQP